jgi:hypothetical protein
MPAIFISYRRDDTLSATGRLADALAGRFGADEVFRDVHAIDAGSDFRAALRDAVRRSEVMLVVMGRFWTTHRETPAAPRLDEPNDYVRFEIEEALAQELPIVPILVEGATMPRADALPDSIRPLAFRHAHEISDSRWADDTERLVDVLVELTSVRPRTGPGAPPSARAVIARAFALSVAGIPLDFLRLVYEPRQLLAARGSGGDYSLVRAGMFLAVSQLIGAGFVLQEWPTASPKLDFMITPPILLGLVTLVTSVPLYAAWRLVGARRDYRRVLAILLYQVSFIGLCLSLVTVVMLVGIKIAVPGAVEQFARTPTVPAASDLLSALQSSVAAMSWSVASVLSVLIMTLMMGWLVMTWAAYRVVLGQSRSRSGIAMAVFAVLLLGPVCIIIWIALQL